MGTDIKLHIHARTAVLRGSRAASTPSAIPFTRCFFASSGTKNQLAAGIKPMTDLSIPRSSAIEQIPPHRQPSVSSQNANDVDMPVTPKTVGRRLLRTRQALKLSQAEFCRQIGVERNLYNPSHNYRCGNENSRSLRCNARLDLCWRPTCLAIRPVSPTRRFGRLRETYLFA